MLEHPRTLPFRKRKGAPFASSVFLFCLSAGLCFLSALPEAADAEKGPPETRQSDPFCSLGSLSATSVKDRKVQAPAFCSHSICSHRSQPEACGKLKTVGWGSTDTLCGLGSLPLFPGKKPHGRLRGRPSQPRYPASSRHAASFSPPPPPAAAAAVPELAGQLAPDRFLLRGEVPGPLRSLATPRAAPRDAFHASKHEYWGLKHLIITWLRGQAASLAIRTQAHL